MLTGELPIGKFQPPSKKVQIDVRLDEVVLRSLENEPGRRYQRASDMRTDVDRISGCSEVRTRNSIARQQPVSALPDQIRNLVQSPADCLIVVACVSLSTAIAVTLWLRFVPTAPLLQQQTRTTLQMMAAAHAGYGIFIVAAGLLMRRLRTRILVLLIATIVGIAFPATVALNVVMEWGRIPQWPVMIPVWLGVPVAVWASVVLFRREVREGFAQLRWPRL
jgi:hypothetical protein